jgi:hypothetical protein
MASFRSRGKLTAAAAASIVGAIAEFFTGKEHDVVCALV